MSEPIVLVWQQTALPGMRIPFLGRLYIAWQLLVQAIAVLSARKWSSGEISRPPKSWEK